MARSRPELPALRVVQWLEHWDRFQYSKKDKRRKPKAEFFIFSMNAARLRSLCGVNRRERSSTSKIDIGIQRRHEENRSAEIARYVQNGYPFSTLSETKRNLSDYKDLRKPGWLPTAIVVNILLPEDARRGRSVEGADLIEVREDVTGKIRILLPEQFANESWKPKGLPPLEVIDGQHRLFAFGKHDAEKFELPVVAFLGLDISWQAYLFWTINIKPKKINASLAFDLYPLLRTEDWLEKVDEYGIYRETRAQELTEALWAYPQSPWYRRINMVGDQGRTFVSQAAWVRSLMASLIKNWEGKGVQIGGVFGAGIKPDEEPLPWSRPQQAAVLTYFWQKLAVAVQESDTKWASALRTDEAKSSIQFRANYPDADVAFFGPHSLLNQDQGVRVALFMLNDYLFFRAEELKLDEWDFEREGSPIDEEIMAGALRSFSRTAAAKYISDLAEALACCDWRSSTAESLNESQRRVKLVYRGSGGYRALRLDVLKELRHSRKRRIANTTENILENMRGT